MKLNPHSLRALSLLAALIPLAAFAAASDPAKPQDTAAPTPEAALHEIGAPADASVTPTPTPAAKHAHNDNVSIIVHQEDDGENRVSVSDSTYVGPEETIPGNAVAVLGSVKVDGTVNGNSVAVMGSNTINGTVHGNAVCVLGGIKLGPNAHVDGNVVAVVGTVSKAPGAFVGGHVVKQGGGVDFSDDSGAYSWWERAARRGRPIAFGPHLHLFWLLSICTVALYVLLALAFPGGVTKCGETLAHRPGITVLTGVLGIIALPVVFILLLITVVGIPIAFVVLPIGVVAAVMFGKAALYALIGRSVLGKQAHPAMAVLLGVAIIILFLLVPLLGGIIWIVLGFLGYACALTTLFTPKPRPASPPGTPPVGTSPGAPVSPASGVPPAAMGLVASAPEAAAAPAQPAMPADQVPPVLTPPLVPPPLARVSEAALPRAGFWIRMVALILDVVLIGIVTNMHDLFPVALATYAAILWKLRGATVGDIIFGLKVVRVDGAPMEWVTVVVRALACFFSIIVVGLGFIWIAFDREKQGWHDKIAGTVVVRHPRSPSLV
jgi:uncharacterized RDD family membrane protein YckC